MQPTGHYELLADLFEYPSEAYPDRVWAAIRGLAARYGEAARTLEQFASALPGADAPLAADALHELQEIFTRSFDVQAVTTLSVGYIVFGDDYKRGELLVNLRRECREAGVDCGRELPDHLPVVLRLMARWRSEALVAELVQEIVRPAVLRMIPEFDPARMDQRNQVYRRHFRTVLASSPTRSAIFREPLAALLSVLNVDFPPTERPLPQRNDDFLQSISRELEIERDEQPPAQVRSMP